MECKKEYNVSVYSNLEESLFASFLRVPKRVLRDVVLDLKQVLRYIMLTGKSLYLQIFSPCRIEYEKEEDVICRISVRVRELRKILRGIILQEKMFTCRFATRVE